MDESVAAEPLEKRNRNDAEKAEKLAQSAAKAKTNRPAQAEKVVKKPKQHVQQREESSSTGEEDFNSEEQSQVPKRCVQQRKKWCTDAVGKNAVGKEGQVTC